MDGKRTLAIGALIGLSAAFSACSGAPPAQSGTPTPIGAITKVGGNATTTTDATLLTTTGPGLEQDFADFRQEALRRLHRRVRHRQLAA